MLIFLAQTLNGAQKLPALENPSLPALCWQMSTVHTFWRGTGSKHVFSCTGKKVWGAPERANLQ